MELSFFCFCCCWRYFSGCGGVGGFATTGCENSNLGTKRYKVCCGTKPTFQAFWDLPLPLYLSIGLAMLIGVSLQGGVSHWNVGAVGESTYVICYFSLHNDTFQGG